MPSIDALIRRELAKADGSTCGCEESAVAIRLLHAVEFHMAGVSANGAESTVAAIAALLEGEPQPERKHDLTDKLLSHVRRWLIRSAKKLRHDDFDCAEITIRAMQPGWDDDDTIMCELHIEEKSMTEQLEGRIEGAK